MTEKKKRRKPIPEFLTAEHRAEIENDIKILQNQLQCNENPSDGVGFLKHVQDQIQTPADIQRELIKKRKQLDNGTPKPYETTAQANKAYEYAKKLEKYIRDNRQREKDIFVKYPTPGRREHDFARSVNREVDWMKNGKRAEMAYRYIMRRLDPQNPNAGIIRGM